MKKPDIARAFRDEDYLLSLSEAERASLPLHPAAAIAVSEEDLRTVHGGDEDTCQSGICSGCIAPDGTQIQCY